MGFISLNQALIGEKCVFMLNKNVEKMADVNVLPFYSLLEYKIC